MQAKYCLLFVLLIGSIIAFTDGYVAEGARSKREVHKIFKLKLPLVFCFLTTLSRFFFFFALVCLFVCFCLFRE